MKSTLLAMLLIFLFLGSCDESNSRDMTPKTVTYSIEIYPFYYNALWNNMVNDYIQHKTGDYPNYTDDIRNLAVVYDKTTVQLEPSDKKIGFDLVRLLVMTGGIDVAREEVNRFQNSQGEIHRTRTGYSYQRQFSSEIERDYVFKCFGLSNFKDGEQTIVIPLNPVIYGLMKSK